MSPCPQPLVAVDVGNTRLKLGLFTECGGKLLPEPQRTLSVAGDGSEFGRIDDWLGPLAADASWWIGSVNRPAATRLLDWLRCGSQRRPTTLLAAGDVPLRVDLPRPDMVGIDRLLDALAANHLRQPDRPAIVVDVGTAITVDWVSAAGAFCGGAIAPGLALSARALHDYTDMLPLIADSDLTTPPPPVGTTTVDAMRSGLFWGAVGLIRELMARLAAQSGGVPPHVFLTGGAGPAVADLLGPGGQYVPHLTLAGIALAAENQKVRSMNDE